MRDFKRMQTDPPEGVNGSPLDNDIMHWHAVIFGPEETAWEDGTFQLSLEFTEEYPNKAPTVKFITKMFHPNIYADGSICLDSTQSGPLMPWLGPESVALALPPRNCDASPHCCADRPATLVPPSIRAPAQHLPP